MRNRATTFSERESRHLLAQQQATFRGRSDTFRWSFRNPIRYLDRAAELQHTAKGCEAVSETSPLGRTHSAHLHGYLSGFATRNSGTFIEMTRLPAWCGAVAPITCVGRRFGRKPEEDFAHGAGKAHFQEQASKQDNTRSGDRRNVSGGCQQRSIRFNRRVGCGCPVAEYRSASSHHAR